MDIFVYLTLCFTSLFTLMDPLGVMPVFLQMTDGMDTKERRYIALKACTINHDGTHRYLHHCSLMGYYSSKHDKWRWCY